MKKSLKPLVVLVGALGISFGLGLPTLAQPQPILAQTSPTPALPEGQPTSPSAPAPETPTVPEEQPASPSAPETPTVPEEQPTSPSAPETPTVPMTPMGVSVPTGSSSQTIDAIVRQSPSFELFNALLRVANAQGSLTSALVGGNYTVFAPTDEALAALPPGLFKALVQPENSDTLARILANHIVPGTVLSNQLSGREVRSLDGNVLSLATTPVIAPDIQVSNGVIHAINGVLLPPDVQSGLAGLTPQPVTSGTPSQ